MNTDDTSVIAEDAIDNEIQYGSNKYQINIIREVDKFIETMSSGTSTSTIDILKEFIPPIHSSKCKVCYGRSYIGYEYDSVSKTRGKKVPCPKYVVEVEIAMRRFVASKENAEARVAKRRRSKANGNSAMVSFNDIVRNSK